MKEFYLQSSNSKKSKCFAYFINFYRLIDEITLSKEGEKQVEPDMKKFEESSLIFPYTIIHKFTAEKKIMNEKIEQLEKK